MIFQTKTRRNAIFALVVIVVLVAGGLGWATMAALQVEAMEAASIRAQADLVQQKSNDKTIALALTHLDRIVDATLAIERIRPFEHFRAFYTPAMVADDADAAADLPVEIPSPLVRYKGPDWVLLHFQSSVTEGWSSPQISGDLFGVLPASAMPPAERARHATAANWFEALRLRSDPFTLQQLFDVSQQATFERTRSIASIDADDPPPASGPAAEPRRRVSESDRTAAEFARRGEELLRMQQLHLPAEQCEPWRVAVKNLQLSDTATADTPPPTACVNVWGTDMQPVWLDLTMDGHRQLALVRLVSAERAEHCSMQGVLLDWDRLKTMLEAAVQSSLPGSRIEPVEIGAPYDPTDRTLMRTIPARLVASLPAGAEGVPEGPGIPWGIVLAWCVTIPALAAVGFGTMKYVGIVERRMQFVAAVTHELRTPLTSFQLYTDLLADLGDNPERRRQYIATLRQESRRLARLVENVLVYSRIGDTAPRLTRSLLAPAAVLEAVAAQTHDACAAAGKTLHIENHCPAGARVDTDIEFVIQILANLIENACKYSGRADDPRIWLTARPLVEGGIAFEVEDMGPGVMPADRRIVFKPFRRSSAARDGGTAGMGLGLALSRYWAACLGGRLELKRGEHNGAHFTRFSLALPVSA